MPKTPFTIPFNISMRESIGQNYSIIWVSITRVRITILCFLMPKKNQQNPRFAQLLAYTRGNQMVAP